jgi:hypothetical protein
MLTQGSDRDKHNLDSSNFLHIGHCYGYGIRCLFDPCIRIRIRGWKKIPETGSGMNIPDLSFENLVSVFGVKTTLLYFLVRDLVNPAVGMEKIESGIGD